MKKGGIGTVVIWLILGAIVIAIFGGLFFQTKEKTEKGIFGNLMDRFFPSKVERVTIAGTDVGESCRAIKLPATDKADGVSKYAQAVIDCYNQGTYIFPGQTIKCCYTIDPTEIAYTISKQELLYELQNNKGTKGQEVADSGFRCGDRYVWEIGSPLTARENTFALCWDYQGFWKMGACSDVMITHNAASRCD